MERVALPHGADFTVLIDYAHTPDALERLLLELREAGGRITLLFGCGGDRDRGKRPLMGQIASAYADRIILTSDNPRTEDREAILREILSGIDRDADCTVIADRREAIRYAVLTAERGDTLILAGKGHEEYELDAYGRHPFSEWDTVLAAYAERRDQKQTER
jgi:UDP-N-acetylmuramoyl-L-alanyl-D-glutamate--2,6-diaminopimelate ligase